MEYKGAGAACVDIEYRDERVEVTSGDWLRGRPGDGEIDGFGGAAYVGMSLRVGGNAIAPVHPAAAQVTGVDKDRIDDQWLAPVVAGHLEADLVPPLRNPRAVDRRPNPADLLVDEWTLLNDLTCANLDDQIAVAVRTHPASALERQANGTRVSPRRHREVRLELALTRAVEREVDPLPQPVVDDTSVLHHVGPPLLRVVPDVVVAPAGQLIPARHLGFRLAPDELHAKDPPAGGFRRLAAARVARRGPDHLTPLERQDHLPWGQEQLVPAAS